MGRWVHAANLVSCLLLMPAGACSASGDGERDLPTAPRAVIDRFNLRSGTLYHRPGDPTHPDPNEAISFDNRFLEQALGPSGEVVRYYNLDVKPTVPAPMYVLVDAGGDPIPDQLPIVDLLPDSDGYSDYWRLHAVEVPEGYEANTVKSTAQLEKAGLTATRTDTVVNRPLVPEGSAAALRLDPMLPTAPIPAWYREQVAFYFDFGASERPDDSVPVADKYETFNDNERGPASGRKTEADGFQTHHVFASLPERSDTSPLWHVIVYDNADFDSVEDLASALQASVLDPDLWILNNPIVSVEE
jgi:hypothetical protein